MSDAIARDVAFFENAAADFSEEGTTTRATDLAYAAQDFALCHEVAHIAAQDFAAPDEARADRWGLAAYYGSWGRRPALLLGDLQLVEGSLGRNDPTRAAMGPIAFSCILRSLLCARVLVAQKLGPVVAGSLKTPSRYSAVAQRSREIVLTTLNHRACFVRNPETPDEKAAFARLNATLDTLLRFEVAFGEYLKTVPEEACRQAYGVALGVEKAVRLETEAAVHPPPES